MVHSAFAWLSDAAKADHLVRPNDQYRTKFEKRAKQGPSDKEAYG
jgi:hypothetical protein